MQSLSAKVDTICKLVTAMELRQNELERQVSAIANLHAETRIETPPRSRTINLKTLEDIRNARIEAIMSEFDETKPEATADNFFTFVEHSVDFVKRNIDTLQQLFNPGLMVEIGKITLEIVILLVTTNFVGNPVLGTIDFVQRAVELALRHANVITVEPARQIEAPKRLDDIPAPALLEMRDRQISSEKSLSISRRRSVSVFRRFGKK